MDLFNSSITFCLLIIFSLEISGCSMYPLKVLAPIAVFVLSSTHKSEPRFCFSLKVSHNSRLRLVDVSRIINVLVE